MGSSSSGMRTRSSESRINRTRRKIFSLFCAPSSTSHTLVEKVAVQTIPYANEESMTTVAASSSAFFCTEPRLVTNKKAVIEAESECNGSLMTNCRLNNGSEKETNNHEACLLEYKESITQQSSVCSPCDDAIVEHNGSITSSSYVLQPLQDTSIESASVASSSAANRAADSENESMPLIASLTASSVTVTQGRENPNLGGDSIEIDHEVVTVASNTVSGSTLVSDSVGSLEILGDGTDGALTASRPGLVLPESEQDLGRDNALSFGMVSISSNFLSSTSSELNNGEARRSSGVLWDAIWRQSFRRNIDIPTIVFTTFVADDRGSDDGRWLFDWTSDFPYGEYGLRHDFGYYRSRRHHNTEPRRLRSEISGRLLGGLDEQERTPTFCVSGLHPDGTCSCDSLYMVDESSTLASISRIVLLAEALFEVLDEIHRQPMSFSLSTLSFPAPESVVDSFPLKTHKKMDATESGPNYVKQCYICLVDYAEGDQLRVLPCQHEFHVSCVDKWLKEINGICPLCRCNVCESPPQGSFSGSDLPS